MAKTIQFLSEIKENQIIKPEHIAQLVEAFSGGDEYDITIDGNFTTETLSSGETSIISLNVNNNRATIDSGGNIMAPKLTLIESNTDPRNLNPAPGGQILYFQNNLYFSNGNEWFAINLEPL